jgi:hypothetical protein
LLRRVSHRYGKEDEMNARDQASILRQLVAAAAIGAAASGAALAAPMKLEAVLTPKSETKLELADGSKRFLLATQREGKAAGSGPLAGTTMLEWGVHDVDPASGAHASGYLVFTGADGDVAYLRYRFRGVPVPGADGKPRFVANGFWETAGGTGKLKGLRGAGAVRFIPHERRWILDGELVSAD